MDQQGSHRRRLITTAFNPMTNAERAVVLYELYTKLDELITAEEKEAYPFLDHLADLIEDLEDDA